MYAYLKKVPRKDAERILFAIRNLPLDLFFGDIQKMSGEAHVWRRRIGSYRVKYEVLISEKIIHVFRAERRTSGTYQRAGN